MSPAAEGTVDLAKAAEYMTLWDYFQAFIVLQAIELPLKWFHREICDTLQDAFLGQLPVEIKWIIINMPPRTGKTKILEAFVCWCYAYFHDCQFIYTCYAASLVSQSMKYIGQVMQSKWYTEAFGDMVHGCSAEQVSTLEGGNLYGQGTEGSLTGKGGGLKRPAGGAILIDDPAQPEGSLSAVEAEKVRRWVTTTIERRRNSTRWCPLILCAQRLAPDDLPGYVMQKNPGAFILLKYPAEVDGESQIPETIETSEILKLKSTRYGRYVLASQYNQEPIALGGNLIPSDKFRRYKPQDVASFKWEQIIIVCDTALKAKQWNDASCMQAWARLGKNCYLLDEVHGRWESPMLLDIACSFSAKTRAAWPSTPVRFIIEEKAAGTPLIQQMQVKGVPAEGVERDQDKVRRVQLVIPFIEIGCVFIPQEESTPWIAQTELEWAAFKADGTSTVDDRVDCLADGVQFTLGRGLSVLDVLGVRPQRFR